MKSLILKRLTIVFKPILFSFLLLLATGEAFSQGVMISNNPAAPAPSGLLHTQGFNTGEGNVVFEGQFKSSGPDQGDPPVSGAGTRMMWYPDKSAFRVGTAGNNTWDKNQIGNYSFAAGFSTTASGDVSIAMGSGTLASGDNSAAFGTQTQATGLVSYASGNLTEASGDYATVWGEWSKATGKYSMAWGFITTASGYSATAWGNGTTASGSASTAWGINANASGSISSAWGLETSAPSTLETVMGRYNTTYTPAAGGQTSWNNSDRLFVIGNGSSITRSDAIVVLKSGNTGIGVSSPATRLHVRSNSATGGGQLLVEESDDSGDGARITFTNTARPANHWDLYGLTASTNSNAYFHFWYQGVGNILSLRGNGNATLLGTLTQNSDARLKKSITAIEEPFTSLQEINGYNYFWNDASRDPSWQTGFLAQEVEEVLPELVQEDENGYKSVNYIGLIPYLLEAVKELKSELNSKENEISDLRSGYTDITRRLHIIEQQIEVQSNEGLTNYAKQ